MNRLYCEKEAEIIAAMRCGTLAAGLAEHANACDICSGIAAVSKFLRPQALVRPVLPDSDFLWWKAQLVKKQLAVERATRSIVQVRRIAYCGISAAVLWFVFTPERLGLILAAFSKHGNWLSSPLGQSVLFMGVGALVFALLSSLYLARLEK